MSEGKTAAEIVLAGILRTPHRIEGYDLDASMFQGRDQDTFVALSEFWEDRRPDTFGPPEIIELASKMGGQNGSVVYLSSLLDYAPVNESQFASYYCQLRERLIKTSLLKKIERQAKSLAEFDLGEIKPELEELERLQKSTGKVGLSLAERISADVKVRAVPWVFPDVLPAYMNTAITGDAGQGKTLVAVDMTARVSRGSPFPVYDRAGPAIKGHVFYITSEGVPEMILVPRLMAAGADLDKITIIEGVYLKSKEFSMFDITQHLPQLEQRARDFPDLKMMVFDPIASFLPERINPNQQNAVRQAMDKISGLAYKLGIAAPTIMHFSKAPGVKAIHRTSGSVQFEASVKMSWSVIRREGDPRNVRLLVPQKSNITGGYKSLEFTICPIEFPAPDNSKEIIRTAKIEYGALVDEDPESLISPPQETDNHVVRASEFLTRKLREGTTLYAVPLIDEAERAGVPKWALYKAKDKLGVEHDKEGHFQGRTFWFKRKPDTLSF